MMHGLAVHERAMRSESPARHRHPSVPRVARRDGHGEHGSIVETERTPAHIARRNAPRNPRRSPVSTRNPEPPRTPVPPPSVVMRGPGPAIEPPPRPTVARDRRPGPVVVGAPRRRDRGVPHLPVVRLLLPRPIAVKRPPVHPKIGGEVLRGARGASVAHALFPALVGPPVELVIARHIEAARKGRSESVASSALLSGSHAHRLLGRRYYGVAMQDGQLGLRPRGVRCHCHAVFAGAFSRHRGRRRIDLVTQRRCWVRGAGHREPRAAGRQPQQGAVHEVHDGELVDRQRRAIWKQDLGAAGGGAQPVARQHDRSRASLFGLALAFERDDALGVRNVCRGFVVLCDGVRGRRDGEHTESHSNEGEPGGAHGDASRCRQVRLASPV